MFEISFKINKLDSLKNLVKRSDAIDIAKENIGVIYRRTKSGFGISRDEDEAGNSRIVKVRLPKLDERTKKARRRYKGKKGAFFSPNKSNLTLSGQLLDSMEVFREGKYRSSIVISGDLREPYGNEKTITNVELTGHLRTKGFRFFGLTETDQNIAVEKYRREINKRLRGFG